MDIPFVIINNLKIIFLVPHLCTHRDDTSVRFNCDNFNRIIYRLPLYLFDSEFTYFGRVTHIMFY